MEISEKELKEQIQKEVEKAIAEEAKEQEVESKSAEDSSAKGSEVVTDVNLDSIAESAAEKLVAALQEKLGGDTKDAEALKEKVYTQQEGLKAEGYPEDKDLANLEDDEVIATYFKALSGWSKRKDPDAMRVIKGLSEGTNADGGFLVPTPLFDRVWELLPDMAVMRNLAEIIPMTSQTLKLDSLAARPHAYFIGEGKTKTTTSAEFAQVTLTANKLVARILITEELNDDAMISMIPYLTEKLAQAIATREDKAFFTGTGVGQPRGISIETLSSTNVAGTLNFDKIIDLMNLVRQSVRNNRAGNTAFVAHQNVIQKLRKVKDNDGGYIWRQDPVGRNSGQTQEFAEVIYGRPIFEQNDLADSELYFGAWKNYIIGDRKQLEVRTTDTTTTAWVEDRIDIKAVERIDGRAVQTGAFAKLTGI